MQFHIRRRAFTGENQERSIIGRRGEIVEGAFAERLEGSRPEFPHPNPGRA